MISWRVFTQISPCCWSFHMNLTTSAAERFFWNHVEMPMTGWKAFKMGENRTSAGEWVIQTMRWQNGLTYQLFLRWSYPKMDAFTSHQSLLKFKKIERWFGDTSKRRMRQVCNSAKVIPIAETSEVSLVRTVIHRLGFTIYMCTYHNVIIAHTHANWCIL